MTRGRTQKIISAAAGPSSSQSHRPSARQTRTSRSSTEPQDIPVLGGLDPHDASMRTFNLSGELPPFDERPNTTVVDDKNNFVYVYGLCVKRKVIPDLYRLDTTSMEWKNLTPSLVFLPHPEDRFSGGVPQALPLLHGAATTLIELGSRPVFLIFGGQRDLEGQPSSEMIAVDLQSLQWWVVPIDGAPVLPRVAAWMVAVGNRVCIFGGTGAQNPPKKLESYSVAEYSEDDHKWSWVKCDQPYPSHVPVMGDAGDATVVYGGKKILLTSGFDSEDQINLCEGRFVLFDPQYYSFLVPTGTRGEFPGVIDFYDVWTAPPSKPPSQRQSAILATWGPTSVPEVWQYFLPLDEECRRLDVQEKMSKLRFASSLFVVVGSRLLFLGHNRDRAMSLYDTCIEIKL